MAVKTRYVCQECGHVEAAWSGKCPACGAWASMEEVRIDTGKKAAKRSPQVLDQAQPLPEVSIRERDRIDTGIGELNRVLGGGLVVDSVTMLTAVPGAGKSTLLLQLSGHLAQAGFTVLYASGEESQSQIKMRANRILDSASPKLYLLATTSMDTVLAEARRLAADLLVVDSVQTMELADLASRPGTPSQTVQVTASVIEACKEDPDRPMAAFLVGHVTKEDAMAGLRTLEHQVDTVLYLESGLSDQLRLLRTGKNRFGYTDEVGLFQMSEKGLLGVEDPYEIFLTKHKTPVTGAAVSMQKEGSRLIPIEVEALVSRSYEPYPGRIGDSLSRDNLNTLLSILEERAGFNLASSNVVLKATAGMRVHEKVCDLCILAAIASAASKRPIAMGDAFLAEVGLTGELKRVSDMPRRLKELERLGFRRAFVAGDYQDQVDLKKFPKLQVIALDQLSQALQEAGLGGGAIDRKTT